ncbi:alanine--tRNA ligase [Candidatus Woesearchaeota archaeon]|jgi:alanyl-tRNA synthetase|nr:alanine--tRNA ligase [Candidatus Woesearchaeota archaeon]MBT4835467.1 alanine--tRNA ligase [Candidatus Woesearchaeota archaeon]MBT6734841.1 alanine--tRNA ligase [Candidatus Woesearchaeota archaeon]MBT7169644.1 alanine--tRNA ligase [Candidatus Woesearchaeota archaeon]MBT7474602.1 alanine--tRNA ligase [Candidatus Woesearchaeota archaeon]
MKSKNLKKKYIEFFINNGHKEIVDSPLIPYNDPTVLFTTAGMHPLVPFLLGQPNPSGKKLVNIQKCLRTGDIEEVGDEFHLTFFNMLGNWSFGDYWKKEAIEMSFEFLTSKKYLGFPIEKLGVSVFGGDKDAPADEESEKIWESLGISSERIARLGKKDNWWGPAGKTGPCGPDSEMFYWSSPEDVPEKFDPSNSGWVEIWNDVFMEYDKDSSGKYKPLKQKNVDTGMGYERVFSILEGVENIYESSLFTPIIEKILELSSSEDEKSLRIIADHLRSATFLLAEKIAPSNIEQGYVLRKLIRLAIRRGKLLGIEDRFVSKIAKTIIDNYSEEYSHLKKNSLFIITEIDKEERKFERTLKKGMSVFGKISGEKVSGTEAFLLFQSYGFPIEMTQELASEKGMKVDLKGYKSEFITHQKLSRTATKGKFASGLADQSEETIKLHTAAHLLHSALIKVLGDDCKQKGSNINPERLRFDFSFDRKLEENEVRKVEDMVNKQIKDKVKVSKEEMNVDKAKKSGALGEFSHKYGETVFVYSIGKFSKEICSGPHVSNASKLGTFKIVKQKSVGAGVRRIKAILEG